ncbi:hypothetical protein F4801DRAFT_595567 [Xylaria longipes]|nr:hypothetical protein F4801DRAFT_595567 [Xylaria longipes]
MASAPLLPARYEDIQREACPNHVGFYHCGDFDACCAVDPCGFLDFIDPCVAAIASLEDQDSNNDDDGNDNGDGDGDDNDNGNGDGGNKETTSTARHTSTLALPPHSTKDAETTSTADDPETSSAPETRYTSSFVSLPFTSLVEAPSTIVNSTTFATGRSISTSPTGGRATETRYPAPSPTSDESNNNNNNNNNGPAAPLSNTTITGVSVGGVVGGIALLLLLFWLLRRRRLSKRMSSLRGDSPDPTRPPDEKSVMDRRHSLTGTALGTGDVFGGQASSPNPRSNYTDQPLPGGTRQDEGWPLYTASEPRLRRQFSSQAPVYAELDSAETQLAGAGPLGARSPNRRPSPQIHPSQLTPGFPGTQMAIQSRSGSRSTDTDIGQGYCHASSVNASGEVPPRATLNATDHERMNNLYANSWARGL